MTSTPDRQEIVALIDGAMAVGARQAAVEADSALSYGDVFALHEIWKDLGFDRALRRSLRSGKPPVPGKLSAALFLLYFSGGRDRTMIWDIHRNVRLRC
jgi:hypothetical protein